MHGLAVSVGSANKRRGKRIAVESSISHASFGDGLDYDFGLLQLKDELVFGETVQAVKLPPAGAELEPNTTCLVSGWGSLYDGSWTVQFLRAVKVPAVDDATCERTYPRRITARMFCAGLPEGGRDCESL